MASHVPQPGLPGRPGPRHAPPQPRRRALLDAVTAAMYRARHVPELLDTFAELMVHAVADACIVRLVDPAQPGLLAGAVRHRDPRVTERIAPLLRDDPLPQARAPGLGEDGEPLTVHVLATGEPVLMPQVDLDAIRAQLLPSHRAIVEALRPHSLLVVAIRVGDEPLGVLTLLRDSHDPAAFDEDDVELAEDVARHAALALATARVATELADTVRRYHGLAEAVPQLLWIARPDGSIEWFNSRGLAFFGIDAADLRTWRWMEGVVHPDDEARTVSAWREAARRGQPCCVEHRLRRHDGEWRWSLTHAVPLHDASGTLFEWIGSTTDIGDTRQADEQARQRQRLEAVGRLAGGVAHEVNNMMAAVLGFGGLLLESLEKDDRRRLDVRAILDAGERAAAITQQLLAFSGRQMTQPRTLSPGAVLYEMRPLLQKALTDGVSLELNAAPDAGHVCIDRGQLEQVVLNLCLNAVEAMPDGGRLTIDVSHTVLDEERVSRHEQLRLAPGAYVLVAVSDTGRGIDAAIQERVFEPFFTTKPVGGGKGGQGTGLGLSTVYGIVRAAGGDVWLYSEPGLGSTFKVLLPCVEPPAVPPPAAVPPASAREATILVVEDEPMLRKLGQRTLEAHGYRVLVAADGEEALELARQHAGAIDLVVTDLVMPRVCGRELGERLAALWPDLPVLYVSGYSDDEVVRRGLLGPGLPFLAKPYGVEDLLAKVRELLGQRPAAERTP